MASLLLTANSYNPNTADNTTFRAMGTAVSNAFANAGWLQANDAAQINWTTVTANGSSGNVAGYEIWHMNDALQNTTPVYLKVEYGTSGISGQPAWWLTIGTGSDGAGNVTGIPTPRALVQGPHLNVSSTIPWFFCGNPNRIVVCVSILVVGSNTTSTLWSIERTHDNGGGDTSEGALILTTNPSATQQIYWNGKTGPGPVESSVGTFIPAASISGIGSGFLWYPLYFNTGGGYTNPVLCAAYGAINQFPVHVPITLTHYGQPHTYLSTHTYPATNRSAQTFTNFRMLMLWE